MTSIKKTSISLKGDITIELETGRFAPQASAAVTARCGDTLVLATFNDNPPRGGLDFLPLTVDYRPRLYAGGLIKSSRFVKREGRPSDEDFLTARQIDRTLRPVFPQSYRGDLQIIITPLSVDGENEPEILSAIAASAAASISTTPFNGPVGAVRVGLVEGELQANPKNKQIEESDLNLIVSSTQDSLTMIEASAKEVSEETLAEALEFAHQENQKIISGIKDLADQVGKEKISFSPPEQDNSEIEEVINKHVDDFNKLATEWATHEGRSIKDVVRAIAQEHEDLEEKKIDNTLFKLLKKNIRQKIVKEQLRPDGRKPQDIREIKIETGLLPRTHGSVQFKRGLTHALSITTLASPAREQLMETMEGDLTKRYIHHYNMPPFSTGESGRLGWPSRREIGHGSLAERALLPVIPDEKDFPYTIRVVSEIMSSNGSTSQAAVCGSSLALMDAGVPIKKPVAGIAMGAVSEDDKTVLLTDILGVEDFMGDMDFKVAGTQEGITAIQMDVKKLNVTPQFLSEALQDAKNGRLHILKEMNKTLSEPRTSINQYAPRVVNLVIPAKKIGTVIGPGGKMIRQIQEDYDVEVNVEDAEEKGLVNITGVDAEKVEKAKEYVENLTAEVEVGKTYTGTVKNILDFGAFVEVLPGQEGLVHVSEMSDEFVKDPRNVVKEGEEVTVKVTEIDDKGRINLSMKGDEKKKSKGSSKRAKRFQDHR